MPAETVQEGGFQRADRIWPMPVALRRVLLLVPPLLLAGLEKLHPQPDETVQALMDASTWFVGFHVIQLALTGLVGLSVLFARRQLRTRERMGDPSWSRSLPRLLQRLRRGCRDRHGARDAKRARPIGRATGGRVRRRQGLAGCGAAVRTQHHRVAGMGGRGRGSRSGGSPPRSAATRMDPRRTRGRVPAGRAPVPGRDARVRQLLRRRALARMESP